MQNKISHWKKTKRHLIDTHVARFGKFQAKAFPGRCAILIKLLNLTEDHISAVYEKPGSLKIGHYVPGTRIPILSDELLFTPEHNTQPILNLAWHISNEIRNYLTNHNYSGSVIDIITPEDFMTESVTA